MKWDKNAEYAANNMKNLPKEKYRKSPRNLNENIKTKYSRRQVTKGEVYWHDSNITNIMLHSRQISAREDMGWSVIMSRINILKNFNIFY